MAKKILLITYHFPPSGAVGGLRSANFARFLPIHDWEPSVLTIKDKYIEGKDNDRLMGLENIPIFKTGKIPKILQLYHVAKSLKKAILPQKQTDQNAQKNSPPDKKHKRADESILQRLKRYYSSLFLALPDYEKNWIIPATIKAIRLVKSHKIDCILTSCPPYSVHVIGLLTHMATGVQWIADYRDPWYIASQKRMYPTCDLSRRIESVLEKWVVKKASRVVCNTENLRHKLAFEYRNIKRDGFIYLPNGISPETFEGVKTLQKFEKFTLTYTGSLYFLRTPEPIFHALRNLLHEKRIPPLSFSIKLVGHCETIEGIPTTRLISEYGLESYVEIIPPVPYLQSLKIIKESHLALLFAPDQPYQIPAKVYDYIGTGTQILALAGEGATADILQSTGTGTVYHPEDISGLEAFLLKKMSSNYDLDTEIISKAVAAFDRKKITADLASHLNTLFQ